MSYIFHQPVTSHPEVTREMIDWALGNCNSYITCDFDQQTYSYRLYFSEHRDYIWFTLKWKN